MYQAAEDAASGSASVPRMPVSNEGLRTQHRARTAHASGSRDVVASALLGIELGERDPHGIAAETLFRRRSRARSAWSPNPGCRLSNAAKLGRAVVISSSVCLGPFEDALPFGREREVDPVSPRAGYPRASAAEVVEHPRQRVALDPPEVVLERRRNRVVTEVTRSSALYVSPAVYMSTHESTSSQIASCKAEASPSPVTVIETPIALMAEVSHGAWLDPASCMV